MDKISKENQMIKNKIKLLKKNFTKFQIDGYIVPKNDEYFSEYAKNDIEQNPKTQLLEGTPEVN